jgi:hypothetical protein
MCTIFHVVLYVAKIHAKHNEPLAEKESEPGLYHQAQHAESTDEISVSSPTHREAWVITHPTSEKCSFAIHLFECCRS